MLRGGSFGSLPLCGRRGPTVTVACRHFVRLEMVPCLLSFPKCLHFQCSDRVSGCAGLRSRVCTQCRSIKEESTMGTNPAAPAPGAAAGPQPCPVPNDVQKKA